MSSAPHQTRQQSAQQSREYMRDFKSVDIIANVCSSPCEMQLARLEPWLANVGITLQAGAIRIRTTDGGLGVFAIRDVQEGELLCTIPKAAVLSVRTSRIANVLEEHGIRGGLGLIIGILYELSLNTASRW